MNYKGVLLDTDFLIALFLKNQSTHQRAKKIYTLIDREEKYIAKLVKYELATVLSYKFSQSAAKKIITDLDETEVNYLDLTPADEKEIWKSFFSYKKNGVSFIDCTNLILAKKFSYKIASFDQFYPTDILLP